MRIKWTMKGKEDSCFNNVKRPLSKESIVLVLPQFAQAFGQCRLRAKKAASSEKSSERATFLDALSLLSYKLEPGN